MTDTQKHNVLAFALSKLNYFHITKGAPEEQRTVINGNEALLMYLSCAPHFQPEKTQQPNSQAWLNTNSPERAESLRGGLWFSHSFFPLRFGLGSHAAACLFELSQGSVFTAYFSSTTPHQLFPACLPQEITLPPSGHARAGKACFHMKTKNKQGESGRRMQPDTQDRRLARALFASGININLR